MAKLDRLPFYNQVMDKVAMKQLINRLIIYLGNTYTAHILDHLKIIGFKYATKAGISLGIDDLLSTPSKVWLVQDAEFQAHISEKHQRDGSIHAVEKLRQLVETWYTTSEYLKREMNPNFRMTEPLNPVHMMSFSGARGSVSQVHQLVGMRGLMSDPQGQIIDLAIQSNFREGLSLTEYIISCYGARKGVVDTAIRTADAGYLTRRLVEVVQHIIVGRIDCGVIKGIHLPSIQDNKGKVHVSWKERLIGRVLAAHVYIDDRCIASRNQDIDIQLVRKLTTSKFKHIVVRSPLMCKGTDWICQLCYGWSLSHGKIVDLGEAVGIIAGQSIGEPGTQLTLRTFHTGGVFTGDIAEHVRTPFNGIVHFNADSTQATRTRHGRPAWICNEILELIIEGQDKKHIFNIPAQSVVLVSPNQYVESKQVIAEVRATIPPLKEKVQKHLYSDSQGEMNWSQARCQILQQSHLPDLLATSHVWVMAGQLLKSLPIGSLFYQDQDHVDFNQVLTSQTIPYFLNHITSHFVLLPLQITKNSDLVKHVSLGFIKKKQKLEPIIRLDPYKLHRFNKFFYFKLKEPKSILLSSKKNITSLRPNRNLFFIVQNTNWSIISILDNPIFKDSNLLKYNHFKLEDLLLETNYYELIKNYKKIQNPIKDLILKEDIFFEIDRQCHLQKLSSIELIQEKSLNITEIASGVYTQTSALEIKIKNVSIRYLKIDLEKSQDSIPVDKSHLPILSQHRGVLHSLAAYNGNIKQALSLSVLDQFKISLNVFQPGLKKKIGHKTNYPQTIKNSLQLTKWNKILPVILKRSHEYPKKLKHKDIGFLGYKNIPYQIGSGAHYIQELKSNFLELKILYISINEYKEITNFSFKEFDRFMWLYHNKLLLSTLVDIPKLAQLLYEGSKLNSCHLLVESGQVISISNKYLLLRLAKPYLATVKAAIRTNHGDPIKEGDALITLVYERLKSGDIIQGLPKVEQLFEGRSLYVRCFNQYSFHPDLQSHLFMMMESIWMRANRTMLEMKQVQLYLIDEIQKVYQSQGVYISDKHVEVIVRQMTSKAVIEHVSISELNHLEKACGKTQFELLKSDLLSSSSAYGRFLPGELIELLRVHKTSCIAGRSIIFRPVVLGITKASFHTNSFLSEASFQYTIKVLSTAALKGRIDWLKGLKSNVMFGHIIPAGTGCEELAWHMMPNINGMKYLTEKYIPLFIPKSEQVFIHYLAKSNFEKQFT